MDVRRVPGEEERALPVVGGAAVVEAEGGRPDRVAQRQPVGRPVVGDPLEQLRCHVAGPAPRRVQGDHPPGGRGAEGEEEQQAGGGHEGVRGARLQSVDLQVGQQERLRVGVPLEGDARLGAHGAVGTVAADDVAGPQGLLAAVAVPQPAGDVRAGPLGAHQFRAPLHRHVPCGQTGRQHVLRLRLREEEQVGVRRVVAPDVEQGHLEHAPRQVQVQPDGRTAPVDEVVAHAEAGELLQGAGLDGRGT